MNKTTINILNQNVEIPILKQILEILTPDDKRYTFKKCPQNSKFKCNICKKSGYNFVVIVSQDCNHFYHIDCIEKREQIFKKCDICSKNLPSENVDEFIDRFQTIIKLCNQEDWLNKVNSLPEKNIEIIKNQLNDFLKDNNIYI